MEIKAKTIYAALIRYAQRTLNGKFLSLLFASEGESRDKETGEVTHFARYEVEVPRGFAEFSRCRFAVKIVDGHKLVPPESLEKTDYLIAFKDLDISYIGNSKNVYFRASDCNIKKEGD